MPSVMEAAELVERFQWLTPDEVLAAAVYSAWRATVAGQVAGDGIPCSSLCNALELGLLGSLHEPQPLPR